MSFTSSPVYVFAILCLIILLAIYAAKTKWGKQLGAALLAILFTAVVANLKIIPSASNSIELYSGIFTYLAPLSIFYLLLNVNLRSIKQAGLPMIGLFLIGSAATTLGILASWYIIQPERVLGNDANIIAGMLTGTYTGGSVNFNAVALEYNFQENGILYAGTIAVDNVLTTLWILVTLAIPTLMNRIWKEKIKNTSTAETQHTKHPEDEAIDLQSLAWLAFLGVGSFFISEKISEYIPEIPSILTLSTIGIILAQFKFVANLKGSHNLGWYMVLLFLAVIGAYCEIGAVEQLKEVGWTLFLFTALAVLIHGVVTILIGGLVYRDWDMIAITSQANIGGGTTAIALAETFHRKELILPAILVGTLGNAIGSYLGFLVVYLL
tara:strand:+ start:9650 stop:10792 length:1143 start_codon:yes stop_codon:yes gene_type:complete